MYASPVSIAFVFTFDVYNLVLGHWALFGSVLTHSKLESYTVAFFFFFIPHFVRNVLTKFDIFSQSARPVGKLNQLIRRVFFRDNMILV